MLQALGEGDVRALHRTRVASRRLREILPVLQLKADLADRLGRRLKKVTVRLGGVRELDVLADVVTELQASGEYDAQVLRRIASLIADERLQARTALLAELPTRELHRIARKLDRVGGELRDRRPSRGWQWAVDAWMSRRATKLIGAMDTAGALYLPERLHEIRIALKKFRYAVEVSCEAAGVKSISELKTLKRGQDALGRLHDVQVLIDRVRGYQTRLEPAETAMWRRFDAFLASLENDCRRLHAKFMHQQGGIRAICARLATEAGHGAVVRRAS